jgi:AraC-like DNA-binding protein
MAYREIIPDQRLRPFVKCYYIYESISSVAFEDVVYPSGCMELIFNLGSGHWLTKVGEVFQTTPPIELWGQLSGPLPVRSEGINIMLGVRWQPHGSSCFLHDQADLFNGRVVDYRDLSDTGMDQLHERLMEAITWEERLVLLEDYLLQRLFTFGKTERVVLVGDIMRQISNPEFFDRIATVASKYGMSPRYLQKLFVQYTGMPPKLYAKVQRFQQSLKLIQRKDASLTSITYECGYFDQSHFIREFKSFTGVTPSGYAANTGAFILETAAADR